MEARAETAAGAELSSHKVRILFDVGLPNLRSTSSPPAVQRSSLALHFSQVDATNPQINKQINKINNQGGALL
jgi:hypothetical protein